MILSAKKSVSQPVILGFDPGHHKCGLAIMGVDWGVLYHEVIPVSNVLEKIQALRQSFPISLIVMGDQTGSKNWKMTLQQIH